MPEPRAIRYTSAVRKGTKIRKSSQTAFAQPESNRSRNRSPMMLNNAINQAKNTKIVKNIQMKSQTFERKPATEGPFAVTTAARDRAGSA